MFCEEEVTSRMRYCIVLLLLLGVTWGVYAPVTRFEFVAFDDDGYVYENDRVQQGLSLFTFRWAFVSCEMSNWHPVTWMSHALDCQWYGTDHPGRHHRTNLWLHVANTLLLVLLLWYMTGEFWPTMFVAALFALHPLHVESVAWVSERKDVLSTLFWLLSIGAYAFYVRHAKWQWYLCSALLLTFGLMAKPMLVTAPCVLLLLDYWPLGRFNAEIWRDPESQGPGRAGNKGNTGHRVFAWRGLWRSPVLRLAVEKLPLFVIVAVSSIVTYVVQKAGGAVTAAPWSQRLETVLTAYVRYLGKMVYPENLSPLYPVHPGMWQTWQLVGSAGLLLGLSGAVWWLRERKYLLVGWLWFLGLLVPVIGFVSIGDHSLADRYTYLPMTGCAIMAAWGGADIYRHVHAFRGPVVGLALVVVGLCLWRTPLELAKWKDSVTLFTHAIAVTERNYVMHNNLGAVLVGQGEQEQALSHYRSCLAIRDDYGRAHNNLAVLYQQQEDHDKAFHHFREALRVGHHTPQVYNNLGIVLQGQTRWQDALVCFQKALEKEPDNIQSLCNLGNACRELKRFEEAEKYYQKSLERRPKNVAALHGMGLLRQAQGRFQEAAREFQMALQSDQDLALTHSNLGIVFSKLEQFDLARAQYDSALRIEPENVGAHYNLGNLLVKQQQFQAAIRHYRLALKYDPGFQVVHNNLAIVLNRVGETTAAVEQLRLALQATPESVDLHSNLGVLLHQQRQFKEAVRHLSRALQIDPACATAHYNLGNSLRASGAVDKAIESYEKAIRLRLRSADLYNNLGIALRARDQVKAALQQFQIALEIDPNHGNASQNLRQLQEQH